MAITTPCYATREEIKAATDSNSTAYDNDRVDRANESAARTIEGLLHRKFYPSSGTRYFDWPNFQYARSWRLWLDEHELTSASSVVSGGVTLSAADYFLRPDSPPYNRIEIDRGSSASFSTGDTAQRSVAITGVFNYPTNAGAAGALAEALDTVELQVDVTNSAAIGIGHLITIESERLLVADKGLLDTGVNTGGSLTASDADNTVSVADGTLFFAGELLVIGSERMRIEDIAGNTLIVRRAADGSVLATHNTGVDIYAGRRLLCYRGATGTTAATHADTTAITVNLPPALIRNLNIALAVTNLQQESGGFAPNVGSGGSRRAGSAAPQTLIEQAMTAYGRQARMSAV